MNNQQQIDAQQQVDGHNVPPLQANAQANANVPIINNAVNRIQVRVPPFWKVNPQLWFRQLEAQFANSGIINDLTKYNTIVGVLESDILSLVSDVVLNPPAVNLYTTLKARLIHQFTESENKKLKCLLNELTLGELKPSDLLRKMRELSCGKISEELLQTLWLQRLPTTIQTVLATSNGDLNQLVVMADSMFDISETSVQSISSSSENQLSDLVNVVYKIEDKISSLQKDLHASRSKYRSISRNRAKPASPQLSASTESFCYYHKHFGNKAIKCKTPCDFTNSKNSNASQNSRQLTPARK